ncbi:hypothetical protein [Leucobacter sp. M11]|uniref:hypothetical protein n=1 Tax=Leucobacter sp. M11 TaxID=2993565 RepID=UPI002D7E9FA6|nr:hypothetical protein [Leucobacter sp. M11]
MSRWARVGRGASGAAFATLIAAVSHMLAGAEAPSIIAIAVTFSVALPLCVFLAGVRLSVVRLSLGVGLSQAMFHWCFSLVGVPATLNASGEPMPAHANHGLPLTGYVPSSMASGASASADTIMFLWHCLAALLTVLLLRHGEQAVCALGSFVRDALFALLAPEPPRPLRIADHTRLPAVAADHPPLAARFLDTVSTRGPPARLA